MRTASTSCENNWPYLLCLEQSAGTQYLRPFSMKPHLSVGADPQLSLGQTRDIRFQPLVASYNTCYMWFFVLIILLGVPTLIKSAVYFDKHGSNKPKRLQTTIQSWISSPASFSPWKTQIAKKQQASMPHLIFTLMIAMLSFVCVLPLRNFQRKQNCQFVPRCSNRNNPGELHSSVETCITRRLHWGSPS